jgi:hypothetical protein
MLRTSLCFVWPMLPPGAPNDDLTHPPAEDSRYPLRNLRPKAGRDHRRQSREVRPVQNMERPERSAAIEANPEGEITR